ncbi:hypothetical protein NDU88_002329 [Pleurodeles waltl]|uniref:Uncharacterized protein n=1 Tax=Pleurodeles waltl TaxID=8319 RepID=A0AAV7Q6R9_PLEWA|nr:hypothetical protein NDU88_002329 [Pleurodeles waltl]
MSPHRGRGAGVTTSEPPTQSIPARFFQGTRPLQASHAAGLCHGCHVGVRHSLRVRLPDSFVSSFVLPPACTTVPHLMATRSLGLRRPWVAG